MTTPDLLELIGCLAIQSEPVGVILVDLDPALLRQYADILAEAVKFYEGHEPAVTVLGGWATDDYLWPRWAPATGRRGLDLGIRPGALSPVAGMPRSLVVVPDLARAGTVVARAAVTALGNDVVHVERYGVSRRWSPDGLWLASCARQDLAALSPHLLDRFPIRYDSRSVGTPGPVTWSSRGPHATVPPDMIDLIARTTTGRPGVRLDLALARMARAIAELRGGPEIEREDVARAAALVGLTQPAIPGAAPVDGSEASPPQPPPGIDNDEQLAPDLTFAPAIVAGDADDSAPFVEHPADTTIGGPAGFEPIDPLRPEDDPESLPAPRSLHWVVPGRRQARRRDGVVIGHERSTDVEDLAIVPTLFEAALRRRWSAGPKAERLRIARVDLRRYRRRHDPEHALVLVLDHTARRGWDCGPGLAPHLNWAYDRSATVSIVEFGHLDSVDELRPERYRTRTVADRRILASLTRAPGSASPLAAALELASDELRSVMRRGWAAVRVARLVVVTDGRGNVPLEATAEGRVTGRVGRQGVDDALAVASTMATLQRVDAFVVAPDDEQYPQLTHELKAALGGTLRIVGRSPR